MHTIEDMLVEKNYSRCPLKKRPVNYQFDDVDDVQKTVSEAKITHEQPENLSLKKDANNSTTITNASPCNKDTSSTEDVNVSDCCEDEGVDVDHRSEDDEDEDVDCVEDEDEEMIDCVAVGVEEKTTQAAALAAAAAAAAAATAVTASALIVPTPTYPKYGLQPWNFHMSPYTAEFYRTINNPHLAAAAAATPMRGELLSPSSPSDSIGSLSPPPPHYMHGRASSVSPPMRAEIIHRPIGVRHLPQSPTTQHQHRFMPYPALSAYPTNPHPHHSHSHPHHHHPHQPAYPLSYHHALPPHHHAPISPAYSESSYYSMRSLTPESNCSSLPEDLSVKHSTSLTIKSTSSLMSDSALHSMESNGSQSGKIASSSSSTNSNTSSSKKDKNAPPRYQCPDCQKSYSTFSGLTKHQQFHCPAAEGNQVKKSFSCKDCDKTYVSLGALKMHIRTHTLPCKCNICGKAFSRPWLLQGHIRTHTGEKPFSCQHCHRAFADRSNLRAHLQTHSDIKKYSCTNCSKTFSRMSLLTKHSEGGCPGGNQLNSNQASELNGYAVYAEH